MFRRRHDAARATNGVGAYGAADRLPTPLGGANVVAPDDHYYAWQIARIVARLRELRRKRMARRHHAT